MSEWWVVVSKIGFVVANERNQEDAESLARHLDDYKSHCAPHRAVLVTEKGSEGLFPQAQDEVALEIVEGVEGPCVSLNDYRIAGPKPWGGGKVSREWKVKVQDIARALEPFRRRQQNGGATDVQIEGVYAYYAEARRNYDATQGEGDPYRMDIVTDILEALGVLDPFRARFEKEKEDE